MRRAFRDSGLEAGSRTAPPSGSGLREPSAPEWTVIVWEHSRHRFSLIERVVSEFKARAVWIEDFATLQKVSYSFDCSLTIIALGTVASQRDLSLQVIRTLKRKGFTVFVYEEEARSWPLSVQSQCFLAGASCLLDSEQVEFSLLLKRFLDEFFRSEASKRDEERNIKGAMKSLGIVGESRATISVFRTAIRISRLSDLPALITGESGTGKQLLANAIYRFDVKRCNGPFIAVNCSAISPGLVESELFGHKRGAFTGADRDRKGLIRAAQGGILFLDEIGELEAGMQAKLLRVLQENRVLGVGEDHEVPVDVRVIAATNQRLEEMVRQKRFRADLYHRLNVLPIQIPPLRERTEDLKPLVEHFLKEYRVLNPNVRVSAGKEFLGALAQAELPGNTRQLENLVRNAIVHKENETPLGLSDMPPEILRDLAEQRLTPSVQSEAAQTLEAKEKPTAELTSTEISPDFFNLLDVNGWNLPKSLKQCERIFLEAALRRAHGNQSQTARLLGITPRSVYTKVRKYHLQA